MRVKRPQTLGEALRRLGATEFSKLTDEDWDARDRRIEAQIEREREVKKKRDREDRRAQLLTQGAPRHLVLMPPGEWQDTTAWTKLAGHLAKGARGAVLAGGVGTGKTCAGLRWLLDCEAPLYLHAGKLARAEFWKDRPWEKASAILLDDLGDEARGARQKTGEEFGHLVGHAHEARKHLVVTTNMSLEAIKDQYEQPRAWSRLREMGASFLPIVGKDMRSTSASDGTQIRFGLLELD